MLMAEPIPRDLLAIVQRARRNNTDLLLEIDRIAKSSNALRTRMSVIWRLVKFKLFQEVVVP